MKLRLAMLAAGAALIGTTAVAADPAASSRQPQQADSPAPRLLLASADEVRAPAPSDQQAASTPKRPRIARVTTCRCGDPQPQAEQDQ